MEREGERGRERGREGEKEGEREGERRERGKSIAYLEWFDTNSTL